LKSNQSIRFLRYAFFVSYHAFKKLLCPIKRYAGSIVLPEALCFLITGSIGVHDLKTVFIFKER
jgi:hypothetical protein